jgi:hypothetical protein
MKTVRPRRGVLAALGVTVLVGLAGGVAYAAVADSGPVIKACAGNVTGLLRLDQGSGCLRAEHALEWNQVGPPGPPGPPRPSRADERYVVRNPRDPSTWIPVNTGAGRADGTRLLTMHLDPGNYTVNTEVARRQLHGCRHARPHHRQQRARRLRVRTGVARERRRLRAPGHADLSEHVRGARRRRHRARLLECRGRCGRRTGLRRPGRRDRHEGRRGELDRGLSHRGREQAGLGRARLPR